jgi:hypothetical protein
LCFEHFTIGRYGSDAYPDLQSKEFLELNGLQRKKNKLSQSNHTLFSRNAGRRLVDFPDDQLSPLKWYRKLHAIRGPAQTHVFHHPASKSTLNFFDWGNKHSNLRKGMLLDLLFSRDSLIFVGLNGLNTRSRYPKYITNSLRDYSSHFF